MAQWGGNDNASNSVIWAPAQFNKAPTRTIANTLYGNTTQDAFVTNETIGMYHVNDSEMNRVIYRLTAATANSIGTTGNYLPGDSLTLANTSGAALVDASVVVETTTIRAVSVSALGSDYANGDTVTFANGVQTVQPVFTVTTGASNTSIASLAITNGGQFTTNPTVNSLALVALSGEGTGGQANVLLGVGTLSVLNPGRYTTAPNTTALATSNGSAGGSGATLVSSFPAGESEGKKGGATGWVLRREGKGGRAGRVTHEVLVAGVGGDSANGTSDDNILP